MLPLRKRGCSKMADDSIVGQKGELVARVVHDDDPQNPREAFDHEGVMVCFHNRYNLGDKHDWVLTDWDELQTQLIDQGAKTILPLYLYDHSGLRIKVGSFQGLLSQGHAEFDSGQVGFIYHKGARKEKQLRAEVEEYDQYLRGDIWGVVIEHPCTCEACGDAHKEVLDSCFGYYGHEFAVKEAKSMLKACASKPKDSGREVPLIERDI